MIKMGKYRDLIIEGVVVFVILFALISNYFFGRDVKAEYEAKRQKKLDEFDITNELTDKNKYSVKSVNHEEMAKKYYIDYKNMIVNYPDEAYEIIENKNDITKEDFMRYREDLIVDYYNYGYESYSYFQETTTNNYVYMVINTKGETFTFKTHAVMNYDVKITL